MPLAVERERFFVGLMGLGVNNALVHPHYFAVIPTGPDPNTALTEGFFELAAEQNPRPTTVALVSADAEFSRNPILGAKANAEKYGFKVAHESTYRCRPRISRRSSTPSPKAAVICCVCVPTWPTRSASYEPSGRTTTGRRRGPAKRPAVSTTRASRRTRERRPSRPSWALSGSESKASGRSRASCRSSSRELPAMRSVNSRTGRGGSSCPHRNRPPESSSSPTRKRSPASEGGQPKPYGNGSPDILAIRFRFAQALGAAVMQSAIRTPREARPVALSALGSAGVVRSAGTLSSGHLMVRRRRSLAMVCVGEISLLLICRRP